MIQTNHLEFVEALRDPLSLPAGNVVYGDGVHSVFDESAVAKVDMLVQWLLKKRLRPEDNI